MSRHLAYGTLPDSEFRSLLTPDATGLVKVACLAGGRRHRPMPGSLDVLTPEERHRLYMILHLEVVAHPDKSLELSGAILAGRGEDGGGQPVGGGPDGAAPN